jgi:hypothetical protein
VWFPCPTIYLRTLMSGPRRAGKMDTSLPETSSSRARRNLHRFRAGTTAGREIRVEAKIPARDFPLPQDRTMAALSDEQLRAALSRTSPRRLHGGDAAQAGLHRGAARPARLCGVAKLRGESRPKVFRVKITSRPMRIEFPCPTAAICWDHGGHLPARDLSLLPQGRGPICDERRLLR